MKNIEANSIISSISKLKVEIKKLEAEISNFRKLCRHNSYVIDNINKSSQTLQLRKVCKLCGEVLGFPSDEDLKENGYI